MTITTCLLTRNHADSLSRALKSMAGVATELLVADTGSTDATTTVAREHGARVVEVPFADDFAKDVQVVARPNAKTVVIVFCGAAHNIGISLDDAHRFFSRLDASVIYLRDMKNRNFLSGVNSQERHEIYEPLWMAAEAKPEHLARRDYFWNGVVLYREKRWAEAYSEFQKARGPDADEDAPLQLYLRRLEPLALHLVETQ